MASMETWDIQETDNNKKYNNYSPKIPNKSISQKVLKVDLKFERYVEKVMEYKNFGLLRETIELVDVASSCGKARGDRLKFSIPYAGQTLTWMALFDSLFPELGPDFDFLDKSFLQDPEIATLEKFVPSLVDWDWRNSDSLLKVLGELIVCYKQHQLDKLGLVNDRLHTHYTSLREKAEIPEEDIEFTFHPDVNDPTTAHFLIRIALNFSKLPDKFSSYNQDCAVLHVNFQGPTWTKAVPQVLLSSKLQELLGGNYRIPQFAANRYLGTYVLDLKKRMNDKMASFVANYEERKEYISNILLLQEKSIIEYDADDFKFITFMLDHNDFRYLVHIKLPDNYPEEEPKTTIHSMYHLNKADLLTLNLNNVPYNSKWDTFTKVSRLLAFLTEKTIEPFKTRCIQISR